MNVSDQISVATCRDSAHQSKERRSLDDPNLHLINPAAIKPKSCVHPSVPADSSFSVGHTPFASLNVQLPVDPPAYSVCAGNSGTLEGGSLPTYDQSMSPSLQSNRTHHISPSEIKPQTSSIREMSTMSAPPKIEIQWQLIERGGLWWNVPEPFIMYTAKPGCNHSTKYSPPGLRHISVSLFYYQCRTCQLSRRRSGSLVPSKNSARGPDIKLGGVCGDVPGEMIAHMVMVITGTVITHIDKFAHSMGRANLWLEQPDEAPAVMEMLDRRVWMAPLAHGYCVFAEDDQSLRWLEAYIDATREGPSRVPFPRHLMTAERWIKRRPVKNSEAKMQHVVTATEMEEL